MNDYSKTVIAKCNELTNNKYVNNFKSLDIMKDKLNKKYATDILVYTNTYDNLLDIITKASANNIVIDSISTINKSEYKVYSMTVLVENKEKLEKFLNDLLNLNFVQRVERWVN